jgi:hypothetical protein
MRTNPHLNALVQGDAGHELRWFSLGGACLLGVSVSAKSAAHLDWTCNPPPARVKLRSHLKLHSQFDLETRYCRRQSRVDELHRLREIGIEALLGLGIEVTV